MVYYDGMHNDTRMNLMIVLTAAQHGAVCSNYVSVQSLLKDERGRVRGARVKDELTGVSWDVRAKTVVNATGPFADAVRTMAEPSVAPRITPAAGVHVTLGDHFCPERMGLIVPKTRDGRVLFFLPWEGSTVCGTTDHASDLTMTPAPTSEDVNFILDEANRCVPKGGNESRQLVV